MELAKDSCVCVCVCVYVFVCMVCVCVPIFMYVCVYVSYIFIYVHTHAKRFNMMQIPVLTRMVSLLHMYYEDTSENIQKMIVSKVSFPC